MQSFAQSEAEYILSLSKEILDDIELSRIEVDKMLLKRSRLARMAGSEEIQQWISYETGGYNGLEALSLKYMGLTGRWTDRENGHGYWGPLAQQQAHIDALKIKMQAMKLPALSGDYLNIPINNVLQNANSATAAISAMSGVQSRVVSIMHKFVASVYYERVFSAVAESLFESYKNRVDLLLSLKYPEILSKIPSVTNRLIEGDVESVSQALTTCRRIIEAFADEIYPPTTDTVNLGGNILKLDASKHQNRINVYVSLRTESNSRRQRLRQNLSNLYDRVSAGVHTDVTPEEALSLFFNVYMFLGEVVLLNAPKAKFE